MDPAEGVELLEGAGTWRCARDVAVYMYVAVQVVAKRHAPPRVPRSPAEDLTALYVSG
jgi:hypothetical protein